MRPAAAILLGALLLGCGTPGEVAELEAASIASLEAYHANADRAVSALLDAYRRSSRESLGYLIELDLIESTETLTVHDLPEPDDAGNLRADEVTTRSVDALTPAQVATVLEAYRSGMLAIDGEVEKFAGQWREAGADYVDAVDLRERIHSYLARSGVGPDEIDAIGRALADEIEKGR